MICLGLDLGTEMGWAAGDLRGQPTFGTERLGKAGATQGMRFAQLFFAMRKLIQKHNPEFIAFEATIPSGPVGGAARSQMGQGYRSHVLSSAFMFGNLPTEEHYVATIRAHFIKNGGLGGQEAKHRTMEHCIDLGWKITNHNEADALALWDYVGSVRKLRQTPGPGDLFLAGGY
jgi:Holliday junction resolvasome RuvABC endonuclease subunit